MQIANYNNYEYLSVEAGTLLICCDWLTDYNRFEAKIHELREQLIINTNVSGSLKTIEKRTLYVRYRLSCILHDFSSSVPRSTNVWPCSILMWGRRLGPLLPFSFTFWLGIPMDNDVGKSPQERENAFQDVWPKL